MSDDPISIRVKERITIVVITRAKKELIVLLMVFLEVRIVWYSLFSIAITASMKTVLLSVKSIFKLMS